MGVTENGVAFMPYGPRWRTHRKLFHEFIDISTVKNHDVNQVKAVSNFLINLYQKPGSFREHIHLCAPHSRALLINLIHDRM